MLLFAWNFSEAAANMTCKTMRPNSCCPETYAGLYAFRILNPHSALIFRNNRFTTARCSNLYLRLVSSPVKSERFWRHTSFACILQNRLRFDDTPAFLLRYSTYKEKFCNQCWCFMLFANLSGPLRQRRRGNVCCSPYGRLLVNVKGHTVPSKVSCGSTVSLISA